MAAARKRRRRGSGEAAAGGAEAAAPSLELGDLVAPLDVQRFLSEYWGRKVYATKLHDAVLGFLGSGFHDGDVAAVIADCRKEDNAPYSQEEISGFANDLEENRKTLSFPFCFTPGALQIKRALLDAGDGLGNDVEVGVYFSRSGGEPTPWHFDNNHNITIQMRGHKEWLVAPGSPGAAASRALLEPPRNAYERRIAAPDVGPVAQTCYSLGPGSVLYLPPGCWHSVSTAGSESFSVDLRVGSVLQARWLCEALFAELTGGSQAAGTPADGDVNVGSDDFCFGPTLSPTALRRIPAETRLAELLARCRLPRCIPFEPEYSDGLHSGASLEFLLDRNFAAPRGALSSHTLLGVSPLVAITPKLRAAEAAKGLILHLRSASALTGIDYLRFSLICDVALLDAARRLAEAGATSDAVRSSELLPAGGGGSKELLAGLLRVLLHANVLHVRDESARGGGPPGRAAASSGLSKKPAQQVMKRPARQK